MLLVRPSPQVEAAVADVAWLIQSAPRRRHLGPASLALRNITQWNKAGKKLVAFILEYQKAMFVEIYRSRWTEELAELDRLIDRNLEQVLEQRYLLARLDVGREADLIEKFLQDLLSTRQIYFADRESLLAGSRA